MIDDDGTANATENHAKIAAASTTAYLYGSELYCGYCLQAFTCPARVKIHFHIEHEPKCPCGKRFDNKQRLLSHAEQTGCKLPFPFEWQHFECSESDDSSSEDETSENDGKVSAKLETSWKGSHICDENAAADGFASASTMEKSDCDGDTSASDDDVEKFDAEQLDGPQGQNTSQRVKTSSTEESCNVCGRTFTSRCSYSGHLRFCRRRHRHSKIIPRAVVNSTPDLKKSLKRLYGVIGTKGLRYICRICKRCSVKFKIIYDHVREDHPAKFRQCLKKKPPSPDGVNAKRCQKFVSRFTTAPTMNEIESPNQTVESVSVKLQPTDTSSKGESDGILRDYLSSSAAVENTGDDDGGDGTRCNYCSRWFSTTSCRVIHERSCQGRRHFYDMQFVHRSFSRLPNGQVRCQLCEYECSPWNPAFVHLRRQHLKKLQKWREEIGGRKKEFATSKQSFTSAQGRRLPSAGTKFSVTSSTSSLSKSAGDAQVSNPKSEELLHSSISEVDGADYSETEKLEKKSSIESAVFSDKKFENPSPTDASLRCPYCQLKFESNSLYKAHVLSCRRAKGGTYRCRFCLRAFRHGSNRNRHEKTCPTQRGSGKSEIHQSNDIKQEPNAGHYNVSLTQRPAELRTYPCQFCFFAFLYRGSQTRHEKLCPSRHGRSTDVKAEMNESRAIKLEDAETKVVGQRAKCVTHSCQFCSRQFLHRFSRSQHEKLCPSRHSRSFIKSEITGDHSNTIKQEPKKGQPKSGCASSAVSQKKLIFSPNCPFCRKKFANVRNRRRHELICPSKTARTPSKVQDVTLLQSVVSSAESNENSVMKVTLKSEPISTPSDNYGEAEHLSTVVSCGGSSPSKSPGRTLQCPHCKIRLVNKLIYKQHILRCRSTSSSSLLGSSSSLLGSKAPADCQYCHRHFSSKGNCVRHERKCRKWFARSASDHLSGKYRCSSCDVKFESAQSFGRHKRYCKGNASKVEKASDSDVDASHNTPKSKVSTRKECRYCKLSIGNTYNCVSHEKLCRIIHKYIEPIDGSIDNLLVISPSVAAAADYLRRCKLCGSIFQSWVSVRLHFHKIHSNVVHSSGTKASSTSSVLPVSVPAYQSASRAFKKICPKCHRMFKSYVGYIQHRATCRINHRQHVPLRIQEYQTSCFRRNPEGRFQCLKCNVSYAERRGIYRHIDSMHPFRSPESLDKTEPDDRTSTTATENVSCSQLLASSTEGKRDRNILSKTARELAYIASNIEHLPDRRFRCLMCGLTQNWRSNMRTHIRRVHGIPASIHHGHAPSTSVPCSRTPAIASAKRSADSALGSPPKVRRKVTCSKCRKCFFSRVSFLVHQRLCSRTSVRHRRRRNARVLAYLDSMCKPADDDRWQCVICDHTYKYKRDVVRHVSNCHGLPAGLDCADVAGPAPSSSSVPLSGKSSPVKSSPSKLPGKT